MKKNMRVLRKGVGVLVLGAVASTLIAGCGGGGATGGGGTGSTTSGGTILSPAGTPVASYIGDGLSGFNGLWINTNYLGSTIQAVAGADSLTGTATPGAFGFAFSTKTLAGTTWTSTAAVPGGYDLVASGWVPAGPTETFVDSGDGIHASIINSNGATYTYSFARIALTGTPACQAPGGAAAACVAAGAYPAGAATYAISATSTNYTLVTPTLANTGATDLSGTLLTALPAAANAGFCDAGSLAVYSPVAAGSTTYNVFTAAGGCTLANISAALAGTPLGTVQMNLQATGNTAVPNVLGLSGWGGTLIGNNNWNYAQIYSLRAGAVWSGRDYYPAPGVASIEENKLAVNAELTASGFTAIP